MVDAPRILCVIPARLHSTRLDRKPLARIGDKTMIEHVYTRAKACPVFERVIVATDSEEIVAVVEGIGGEVQMTPSCETGSDRVAYIAKSLPQYDVVVNLQGDEPFVEPSTLELLVSPYLRGENPPMATLARPIQNEEEYANPNCVKVVFNQKGHALYFSRASIPYYRQVGAMSYAHVGLYAFKRDFLLTFPQLPQTPLEKSELLEQLRALEHGVPIAVSITQAKSLDVNTPEDLERARAFVGDKSLLSHG